MSRCRVLLSTLVLLAAWGVAPTNQNSPCYVPNYQTPWPMAACDKKDGDACGDGSWSFSSAKDCCQSQFSSWDHPYGDAPVELEDAGIAVCGVATGATPPPLSCLSGNETCSCWVPTYSYPWGCAVAEDAVCFRGYDVSDTAAACCTVLISRSESDAIKGGCGTLCQKNDNGVWSCNGDYPSDVVEVTKKLPKCKLDGQVFTLKKPKTIITSALSRASRGGSESDGQVNQQRSHGCLAKPKDLELGAKKLNSRESATLTTLDDVVEIDIYFNIMESPNGDSFPRVTRTQIEDTVKFMNEKYFFPQLNQGFKFTLKSIYRWTQDDAAWAWTGDVDTDRYEDADKDQAVLRGACREFWKGGMRATVLGDQVMQRGVLMAYIVDYQYTGGSQGQATFPSDLFNRTAGQYSIESLFIDGFEGDPSSLTGYNVVRPHLPSDLPLGSGGTIAHEVGHWLGLFHTFEDGIDLKLLKATDPNEPPLLGTSCKFDPLANDPKADDYGNRCCELNDLVADTPRALKTKDFYNKDITCTGTKCDCKSKVYSCEDPEPDLLTNLMDYLDACYADGTFTVGQLLRMRDMYTKYRLAHGSLG